MKSKNKKHYFEKISKSLLAGIFAFSGSSSSILAFTQAVKAIENSADDSQAVRLIVSSEEKIEDKNVIGQYENVYLLEYENEKEANAAYDSFLKTNAKASFDCDFSLASDNSDGDVNEDYESAGYNPIEELSEVIKNAKEYSVSGEKVIAVIDTKVTLNSENIIDNVSVLGDEESEIKNDHGNKIVSRILEQNPDAKILAIEAINGDGTGTLASVYSAIEYAIAQNVDIINLSISAYSTEENQILSDLMLKAQEKGITVVGAAGNNGDDVKNFVPGNIESVVVVGSCDANGNRITKSNFGSTVDYYIYSEATSYAAAIASGILSKNEQLLVDNQIVFSPNASYEESENKTETIENNNIEETEETVKDEDGNEILLSEEIYSNGEAFSGMEKSEKDIIVKYLYVDASKTNKEESIDDIWERHESIISYTSETVPSYVDENGDYHFLANTPYRNKYAKGDVLTYCFAYGNNNAEIIQEGVNFDKSSKIATISSDVFKKENEGDYSDLVLQVVVPVDLNSSVKIPYKLKDSTSKALDYNGEIELRPYTMPEFQIVSNEDAESIKSIKVWINGKETEDFGYDPETGILSLAKRGVEIYSITLKVEDKTIVDDIKGLFGVSATEDSLALSNKKVGQTGGVAGYLKQSDTLSNLTVGQTWYCSGTNAWVLGSNGQPTDGNGTFWSEGTYSGNFNNNFTAIATDNAECYYNGQGGVAAILYGIPLNMFGTNTQIYSDVNCTKAVPTVTIGNRTTNAGVYVACRHISAALAGEKWLKEDVLIRCVDKSTDAYGYTHIVLAMETYGGGTATSYPSMVQSLGAVFELAFFDEATGTIQIQKSSSNKEATTGNTYYSLAGTQYKIYKDQACTVEAGTFTVDENGDSNVLELEKGTYYLKESIAGQGFILDTNVYTVVNNANKLDVISLTDSPALGSMIVRKKSSDTSITDGNSNYYYTGIEYTLYKDEECKEVVDVFKINSDGDSNEISAIAGVYYLKETKTNECFALDEKVYKVTNNFNKNIFVLKDNPNLGKITLKKYSSLPGFAENNSEYYSLAGAEYTVYEDAGCTQEVGNFVVKEDGSSNVLELKISTYYVKETKAPKGYELDEEIYEINNTFSLNTLEVEDEPILGKLNLVKESSDKDIVSGNDKYSLKGAEYTVYTEEGCINSVGVLTTNENGNSNTLSLKAGIYYIKETKAAENYSLDTNVYRIENTFELNTLKVKDAPNYLVTTLPQMTIVKNDSATNKTIGQTDAVLENAEYTISFYGDSYSSYEELKESGASPIRKWVFRTDVNGTILIDEEHYVSGDDLYKDGNGNCIVPYGTLDIVETKSPKGYKLDNTHYIIDTSVTTNSGPIVLKEDVKTGTIKIVKTATTGLESETVSQEKDAEFTVIAKKYVDKYGSFEEAIKHIEEYGPNEYKIVTTNENGEASAKNLAYGNYVVKQTKVGTSIEEPEKELDICEDEVLCTIEGNENEVHTLSFNNISSKYGLKIVKVDSESGEKITLSSAKFKIKDSKGNYIKQKIDGKYYDTFVTNSDGKIGVIDGVVSGLIGGQYINEENDKGTVTLPGMLESGKYIIEEIETPEGYVKGKNVKIEISKNSSYEISNDGNPMITVVFENSSPKGEIDINKSISNNESIDKSFIDFSDLKNFEFKIVASENIVDSLDGTLIYSKGDTVGLYKTDEKGEIKISDLPLGKYQITEMPRNGYIIKSEVYNIDLSQKDTENKLYKKTIKIENEPSIIEIEKIDSERNYVSGAKMQIYDEDGKFVCEWTTENKPYIIAGLNIGEHYTLEEISAPDGYVKASSIDLIIDNNSEIQSFEMTDKIVTMSKVDVGGEEIEGATIQVVDSNNQVVDEWTSGKTPHKIKGLEEGKAYTLKETVAADGYVKATDIEFTVTSEKEDQHIEMTDKMVTMSKVDVGGKEIEGATIQVVDSNNQVVDEWTSGKTPHRINGLIEGESYTLREKVTIDGYVKAADIEFTVTKEKKNQHIDMVDKIVTVSKTDVGGEEIEGAKLQIVDKETNEVVDSWTSTKEEHRVKGLDENKTYILQEVVVADGYVKATEVEFAVSGADESGVKVDQHINMIDKIVSVSKLDVNGEFNEGAKLQVVDNDGNIIDSWTSGKESHKVLGLIEGESYILQEVKATDGYVIAASIPFAVTGADAEGIKENQQIEMKDKKMIFKKQDESGDFVIGAKMTVRDLNENIIDEWTSSDKDYAIKNLVAGQTYILREDFAPLGYAKAIDIVFTVNDDFKDQYISMTDKIVTNKKVSVKGDSVVGARLQVIDKDGNIVDEWTSDGSSHKIKNLKVGESYTLFEVEAPEGFVKASPVIFYVEDDGKNQSFDMIDKQISMSKVDVSGEEIEGAKLQVIDKFGNVIDSWTSEKEPHNISGLIEGQSYVLQEVVSADGYVKATDIVFTATTEKINQHIDMIDKIVFISKKDIGGEEVEGATLQVIDKETKEVIDSWTSTKEEHKIKGLEENRTYILQEVIAANGYVKAADVEFTVSGEAESETKEDQHIEMIDKIVTMSKVDVGGEEIEGATIQVVDSNNQVVDEWTSGKTPHKIKGLEEGKTYTLKETVAANGYVKAQDIEFTVTGENIKGKKENQHVEMTDKFIEILKVDSNNNPLQGAKMELLDEQNNVIDSWVSEETYHLCNNLIEGKSYTLRETEAPSGYVKAKDMQIFVYGEEDGNKFNQRIVMVDKQIIASKLDVDENPVIGSLMRVIDHEGNIVDEWITSEEVHYISGTEEEKVYRLVEEKPADGYVKAADITFTVSGSDYNGVKENQKIEMIDKIVEFTKLDISGSELEGAQMRVIDKEGNTIDSWTSGKEAHKINGLVEGNTYILQEVKAPDGYVKAQDIEFTVNGEDESGIKVNQNYSMTDKNVNILKYDLSKKVVEGAVIQILDKDGNIVDEWTTGKDGHNVSGLIVGQTYVIHESYAPGGYSLKPDEEFTVEDDFEEQYIDIVDKTTTVKKVDQNGNQIEGAQLQATVNGEVIDSWMTGQKIVEIPDEIKEKLKNLKGNLTWEDEENVYSIEINRVENENLLEEFVGIFFGKDIEDYRLYVENKDTGSIDYYNVDAEGKETSHRISGLSEGDVCIISEVAVPEETDNGVGYLKAEEYMFTVSSEKDTKIEIVDTKYDRVEVEKIATETKKPLEGAELVVKDSDGNIVDSWISSKEQHILDKLIVGETYTLIEKSAPEGYKIASPIEFKIDDNGEIVQVIVMEDDIIADTGLSSNLLFYGMAIISASILLTLVYKKKKK